jgi:hypothetical protein
MPWHILDIAPTTDEREIRRAYAQQLKTRQHEEDAEFFERLRWAYETALAWAQEDAWEEDIKETPDLFPEPPQVVVSEAAEEIPELIEKLPEEIPAQTTPPILEPDFAQDAEPPPESPSDETTEILDLSSPPKETLEELLRDLENILEKEAQPDEYRLVEHGSILGTHFVLQPHNEDELSEYQRAQSLCMKWETLRIHPQLESLAEREIFSEELAILLARHWPNSAVLWPWVRDFFAWQPPAFSENTAFARALRELFENAETQKIPENTWVRKETWKDYLRGFSTWTFYPKLLLYPGRLLLLIWHISKNIFGKKRPFASPRFSLWKTTKNIGRDLHESTKLALQCMLGYIFFIFELFSFSNVDTLFKDYTGPRILFSPIILFIFLFLHFTTIAFLPRAHAMLAFRSRLFRHARITACFFVIYFWIVSFSIPARIIYVAFVDWIGKM